METMRIGMLLDAVYPTDVRVEKETRALAAAGHEAVVLSYAAPDRPDREAFAGATVLRRPLQDAHDGLAGLLPGLAHVVTGVHRGWAAAIEALLDEEGVDVLHVHDLPLARTALTVGERRGVPVVLDLHENWPEALRLYRAADRLSERADPRWLLTRVLNPVVRWKRIERDAVRRATRVITVAEEAGEHYVDDCGADPGAVRVVSNYVRLESFAGEHDPAPGFDGEFVVSYVGSLGGEHRGLDAVVRAMPAVRERVPNARLVIVGGGVAYMAHLKALTAEVGVEDVVTFAGHVPFEEVPGYIEASDVCLVPHLSTGHTETTVPHKLFQYMAVEKPVVVTDVAPLERIVEDAGAGVVVPSDDDGAFAEAFVRLAGDPELRAAYGAAGRAAVEGRYNWAREAETLVALYDELAGEVGGDGEAGDADGAGADTRAAIDADTPIRLRIRSASSRPRSRRDVSGRLVSLRVRP
jgi:glycosyltransferase involved in cell wall biosynthesis